MTSLKLRVGAALLIAAAMGSATARAHHSAAMFDDSRVVELKGVVKELQWTNPHIWIQVNVDKAGAAGTKEEWSFEGGSPNSLSRSGWKKTSFVPGQKVTIRFNPMRDGTHAGQFVAAKFEDGTTLGRWQ